MHLENLCSLYLEVFVSVPKIRIVFVKHSFQRLLRLDKHAFKSPINKPDPITLKQDTGTIERKQNVLQLLIFFYPYDCLFKEKVLISLLALENQNHLYGHECSKGYYIMYSFHFF